MKYKPRKESKMRENRLTNRIILALLDNRNMSARQIAKYIGHDREGSVYSAILRLRRNGLVEHSGYSKYTLTDLGKLEAGKLLSFSNPPVEEKVEEIVEEVVDEVRAEPVVEVPSIDWASEYIRLANNVVDALKKNIS